MHMKIVDTSVLQWPMNLDITYLSMMGSQILRMNIVWIRKGLIRVNRFATALLMPKDIFTDKYRLFHF